MTQLSPREDFGSVLLEVVKYKAQHLPLTKEPKREMAKLHPQEAKERKDASRDYMGKQTQHGWQYGRGCDAALPNPMSILSRNCQGLRNSRSVLALTKTVKAEAPFFIFFVETKAKVVHCQRFKQS